MPIIRLYVFLLDFLIPFLRDPDLQCSVGRTRLLHCPFNSLLLSFHLLTLSHLSFFLRKSYILFYPVIYYFFIAFFICPYQRTSRCILTFSFLLYQSFNLFYFFILSLLPDLPHTALPYSSLPSDTPPLPSLPLSHMNFVLLKGKTGPGSPPRWDFNFLFVPKFSFTALCFFFLGNFS
jgi:hypothetical protein